MDFCILIVKVVLGMKPLYINAVRIAFRRSKLSWRRNCEIVPLSISFNVCLGLQKNSIIKKINLISHNICFC